MAVNETRSMNTDFAEGGTDGIVKKLTPDRGGVVEPHEALMKAQLHDWWYGVGTDGGSAEAAAARRHFSL